MRRITSFVLCLAMLMCATPMSAHAMELTPSSSQMNVESVAEASTEGENSDVIIVASEDGITPYANPKDLYYTENAQVLAGVKNVVNVTPTKGRALRVWLKVESGSVELKVVRPGFIGYVTEYDATFGAGARDVEVAGNCNGKTYQIQLISKDSTNGYNTVSMLIYETGG